jgi:hypothetical protein
MRGAAHGECTVSCGRGMALAHVCRHTPHAARRRRIRHEGAAIHHAQVQEEEPLQLKYPPPAAAVLVYVTVAAASRRRAPHPPRWRGSEVGGRAARAGTPPLPGPYTARLPPPRASSRRKTRHAASPMPSGDAGREDGDGGTTGTAAETGTPARRHGGGKTGMRLLPKRARGASLLPTPPPHGFHTTSGLTRPRACGTVQGTQPAGLSTHGHTAPALHCRSNARSRASHAAAQAMKP